MNTIYLVDDHPMLRGGLRHLVDQEGSFRICGEASTAVHALAEIPLLLPDIVVMDVSPCVAVRHAAESAAGNDALRASCPTTFSRWREGS